ncbi:EAL domain-containing response regulator [Jiella sonneratiae]|uniref:EAL domain-containing response regulator n=1 Tax=Jiella sonneratiae TaxID=2816856 RepID=A0ABS3JCE5_9HYPH|nr:EAL domain-containing response regulator [Jiella sonneratiae]MBO0906251.1 EAL domain-containing response regulator [Jiella sonneratiae]
MVTTRHILIVDDDPIFTAVAESVIRSAGCHRTSVAADGREGLALLAAAEPPVDVVLLDLNMPNLDGLAYLRALGERGYRGAVIISSGESGAIVDAARQLGRMLGLQVCGALGKPLRREAFLAELAACEAALCETAAAAESLAAPQAVQGEIVPHFQPQIALGDGRLVGLEALVRLKTPDGRLLGPPAVFHAGVRDADLPMLTLSIADRAMAEAARWRAEGHGRRLSINLDARTLDAAGFQTDLLRLVERHGLEPGSVVFELTETALPKSLTGLVEQLTRMRMAGFGLSLDDYGTGTANYALLRLCPFSELKIDKSIVQSAALDRVSRLFLMSSVAMASDLGMEVVAEGVETREQLTMVEAAGVSIVQGFIYSPAVRADLAFPKSTWSFEPMRSTG